MQLFFEKRTLTSFLRVVYLMSGVKATSQLICRLASMHLICNPIHECAAPFGRPTSLYRKLIWPYKRRRSRYARFSISTIVHIYTHLAHAPTDTDDLRNARRCADENLSSDALLIAKIYCILRFILYIHLTLYVHFTGVLYISCIYLIYIYFAYWFSRIN